jgi:DnaJ-class molecular chaperone
MAKLSARGRTKLGQVALEKVMPELDTCLSCGGKGTWTAGESCELCKGKGQAQPLCTWERKTKAYMSDGNLLEKLDVRFRPGPYDHGKERFHSYGWKVRGKVKAGLTVEAWLAMHRVKGWDVEKV